MRKLSFIFILILTALLVACGSTNEEAENETNTETETTTDNTSNYPNDVEENPIVTITMENGGEMMVELYPEVAPNTVANFIALVQDGFYDGVIFHRVIPGFMIQGGDPNGQGTGGPGYAIDGEFSSNGFENTVAHERGVISMARTQAPNSAGSQFFIMHENSPHLDGDYAAFGKVIEGIEVVDAIVSVERNNADKPLEDQVM